MDTPDERLSLSGDLSPGWAVPVPIQKDELLSSWLVRVALAQGCDPLVMTGHLWPKWRIWTIDLDRGLPTHRLGRLAISSGTSTEDIEGASLRAFGQQLQPNSVSSAIWPWLLAQGSRNRRRYGGLQYCPRCFASDAKPYFRRAWRMAWHTVCEAHGEELHDRCANCQTTPEPHRLNAGDGRIDRCATCKADFKTAPHIPANADALAFQRAADDVIRAGWGRFGDTSIDVADWFALAHFLVTLVRRIVGTQPQGFGEFLAKLDVGFVTAPPPASFQLPLELLPVPTRSTLFSSLPSLIEAGPVRMLLAARAAHLTAASFIGVRRDVPDALRPVISALPMGYRSARRAPKKINAFPRSPAAVLRHCARMQRRLARS